MEVKRQLTLSNGVSIPTIGLGTWQMRDGDTAYNAVKAALKAGYTHIDTAQMYMNEESVGRAVRDYIKESGKSREELFIATKLGNSVHGYEDTKASFKQSRDKLGLGYIDLFLIHWPNPIKYRDNWQEANYGSWRAMEELYKKGEVKAIGISNFWQKHIIAIEERATVAPMVNQIKLCPGIVQEDVVKFSRDHNMLLEAYSPIATGALVTNPLLVSLATKYNKSVAAICVRYCLELGYIPLPKSTNDKHIASNLDVFDFTLDQKDIVALSHIEGVKPPHDPDTIEF